MDVYDVIIRPIVTEKSLTLRELGQYVFEVHRRANKIQVRKAIEEIYGVKVETVNVSNMPAKITRTRGRRPTTRHAAWKKAVVTLAPGERIKALEA